MAKNNLKIKVDVDNVLNQMVPEMFSMYEKRTGKRLLYNDCVNYDFSGIGDQSTIDDLYNMFLDKEMWDALTPPPNAQQYLKRLNEEFDVRIVTATHYSNFGWKVDWLLRYYKFLRPEQIICCHDKTWILTDFAIDDYQDNLRGEFGYRILIDAPWNRNVRDDVFSFVRVSDMKEAYKFIIKTTADLEGNA